MGKHRDKSNKGDVSAPVKFFFTVGVLAVLLFIGIFIYHRIYMGPSSIVDEYVDAFMAKSPSRLFKVMNLEESFFLTPENLDKRLREVAEYEKFTSYSMLPKEDGTTGDNVKKYELHYMEGRLESPFTQVITVRKSDENFLFLFDRWQIDPTDMIARDVTIRVPLGAELTVDDINIPATELRRQGKKDQDFELGDMFSGAHVIKVKLDGFDDHEDMFELEPKSYAGEPVVKVTAGQMKPDDTRGEIVSGLIEKAIPKVYENMLQRRTFDHLLEEVAIEPVTRDGLRRSYEAMIEDNADPEDHLTFISFDKIVSRVTSTLSDDNCYAYHVVTVVRYTTERTVVVDGEPEIQTARGKKRFKSVFHFDGNQWWVHDSDVFDRIMYADKK